MKPTCLAAALALAGGTALATAAPTLAPLQDRHRLLIVSDAAGGAALAAQRAALAAWQQQAQDRDLDTVVLDGARVDGADEPASAIRARYAIPAKGFAVALVGKDGHVAYRATRPVTGPELERVIDAMPMRRAGLR